jgi:hypothetical protein
MAAARPSGFQYHIEKPVTLLNLGGIVALLALKGQPPSQGDATVG